MNLDLHLLQVFLALFETRSVGQAAIKLKMSQPGLSTALRRLRVTLQDPLFIKTSRGMEPTSRAQALLTPIRTVVKTINTELLIPPGFDAKTSTREFRLALSDIGEGIYLPLALRSIQKQTSSVSLRSVFMPPTQLEEEMSAGTVDLAFGYFPDIKGNQFFQRRIGLHSFACIIRSDHPMVDESLTMKQFREFGHVVVQASSRSQEIFEEFMKAKRFDRNVVLSIPHFMSVPIIVANTDAIAVVPQALADFFDYLPGIKQVRLPFVPPTFQVNMYWHRSAQVDPGNKWLRNIMTSEFPEIQRRSYHRSGGSSS
jgi:DNA-binding transcriptional LysR family regulator